jgi:N-methylhydantoinase A
VARAEMRIGYQVDIRYHGQGLQLTVNVDLKDLEQRGLAAIAEPFDAEHKRLFTFVLPLEHELVNLRAFVQGRGITIDRPVVAKGGPDPKAAAVGRQKAYMDGKDYTATVYDRAKLKAGNRIAGPAIVMEMDSTTVILPRHHGVVDRYGNILIYPDGYKARPAAKAAPSPRPKPQAKAAPRAKAKSKGRK